MEPLKEVALQFEISPSQDSPDAPCFLWMALEGIVLSSAHPLSLMPVVTEEQEATLKRLRMEAEVPSRNVAHEDWYLATVGREPVGVVGIVEFQTQNGRVGRLQDLGVTPRFQGMGYGNLLLQAACRVAQRNGLDALVIVTDPNGWARLWCKRRGFMELEAANPSSV